MIIKSFDLQKLDITKNNIILFYGQNQGAKEEDHTEGLHYAAEARAVNDTTAEPSNFDVHEGEADGDDTEEEAAEGEEKALYV